jgi:hypothetical protein
MQSLSLETVAMSTATTELVRAPADRAPSVHKRHKELRAAAAQGQREATSSSTTGHIRAGELATVYLSDVMAGVASDHDTVCLGYIDAMIDDSPDGRTHKARRPEVREQVCAAALVGHIPALAGMPWRHVRAFIGAKIVTFDPERGTADVNLDWLQGARVVVGDYHRSPCDVSALREALAGVTGRETSEARKARRKAAEAAQAVILGRIREALPTMSDADRAAVLRQYPELDPSYVHEETVVGALSAINPLRGTANYVETLARLLASTGEDVLTLAMERAAELSKADDGNTESEAGN